MYNFFKDIATIFGTINVFDMGRGKKHKKNANYNRNVQYKKKLEDKFIKSNLKEPVEPKTTQTRVTPTRPVQSKYPALNTKTKTEISPIKKEIGVDIMIHYKQKLLEEGKTFETSEKGNSMIPLLKSGQKHILAPINLTDVKVGDIVFARVGRAYFTHLVTAIDPKKGAQISNNKGHVNGWTKNVFGKVINIM